MSHLANFETCAPRLRTVRGMRRIGDKPASVYSTASDVASDVISVGKSAGRLLRVWLRNPWQDYEPVTSKADVAYCKGSYFAKATIRDFSGSEIIPLLQRLYDIHHPNIAAIHDIYYDDDDRLFAVAEHLELSLTDLKSDLFPFMEWEIATVINEVS